MTRTSSTIPRLSRIALAAALGAWVLGAGGCRGVDEDSVLSGNVVSVIHEVAVPGLPTPQPDVTASLQGASAASGGAAARTGRREQVSQQATATPVVRATSLGDASRIDVVLVRAGDTVSAGETLAVVDTGLLAADVKQAKAAWRRARAQVFVLEERSDDVSDARQDVVSRQEDLEDTVTELQGSRADLAARLSQARTMLERSQAQAAMLSGSGQPPTVATQLQQRIRQLQGAIMQLESGIARLDRGLAQASEGRERLRSARSDLSEARRQVQNGLELARISRDAARIGVEIAEAYEGMAVLRSPVDGVVVEAVQPGAVLSPGATVAGIRPLESPRVSTWIPADRADEIEIGSAAEVSVDSLPGKAYPARVSFVGEEAAFPPTAFATRIIHMLRAVPLEVTLEEDATLPAGTPADVTVTTR